MRRLLQAVAGLVWPEETKWHEASLEYLKRANRHQDSIDPNYFLDLNLIERSEICNLVEHEPAPKLNQTERRRANYSELHIHPMSFVPDTIKSKEWSITAGPEAPATDTVITSEGRLSGG